MPPRKRSRKRLWIGGLVAGALIMAALGQALLSGLCLWSAVILVVVAAVSRHRSRWPESPAASPTSPTTTVPPCAAASGHGTGAARTSTTKPASTPSNESTKTAARSSAASSEAGQAAEGRLNIP
jgi:hypothetical protein